MANMQYFNFEFSTLGRIKIGFENFLTYNFIFRRQKRAYY